MQMIILKPKQFRLSPISSLLLGAVAVLPLISQAAASDETLYLSISVNGIPVPGLFQIHKQGQDFLLSPADFKLLRLKTSEFQIINNEFILKSKSGFKLHYNDLQQQLDIQADTQWLGGNQQLSAEDKNLISTDQLSPVVKGMALNYSLYGSDEHYGQNLSAYTQLRSFGIGPGNFSSSFNNRFSRSTSGTDQDFQRLMTSWTYNNPDKLLTLTVGDNYSGSQSWTNSVRFAGLSLSHNYSQQPDYNTTAKDILSDTVALPSTVDLYVQGVKQSSRQVEPGQFTLNTAPVFTGNSAAQVVITDINGQQRVVNLNLYGSDLLLTPGINVWSINAGWIRKDYSYRSFSYDHSLIAIGNARYGLTNNLTLEGHTEQGQPLQNGGAGVNYLLSPWLGVVHSDYSVSQHQGMTGQQWGLGWQWSNQRMTLSASHNQRSSTYADSSVLEDGILSTRSDNAFMSWSVNPIGTVDVSWINRNFSGENSQYVGLSWSRLFPHSISVSASLTRAMGENNDQSLYLSLSVPLSGTQYLNLSHNQDNQSVNNQLAWSKSLESGKPGWGASASISQGDNATTHLSYNYRSTWSDSELGYNHFGQQNNYYGSLAGAVGWFNGGIYATRQLGDAFAIVDTGGIANIPVYLSHNPVGKTDSHGRLFLNNLLPYYKNDITIDVLSLPEDYRALDTEKEVIPASGGGATANFSVYRTRAVLLTTRAVDGKEVDFAAPVNVLTSDGQRPIKGTASTIVGYGGEIYLENPPEHGVVIVHLPGGDCHFGLPEKLPGHKAIVNMGAICR